MVRMSFRRDSGSRSRRDFHYSKRAPPPTHTRPRNRRQRRQRRPFSPDFGVAKKGAMWAEVVVLIMLASPRLPF